MFDDFLKSITPEQTAMLTKAGSADRRVYDVYARELAKALELPLRKAILPGDILGNIYERITVNSSNDPEFPVSLLAPGSEGEYVAYTLPKTGYIPHKKMEGDYVKITTYRTGGSIDVALHLLEDARWDIMSDVLEALRIQFVKKFNDDGMHTLLFAAQDRNIVVYDGDAANGQFTKRVISLAKSVMRRNGGGNASSVNQFKLTDLLMSPEGMEDIRNWGVDQVDEITRREIYTADDNGGALTRVFGVNLHDVLEFGDGQEYQLYYENELSGTMAAGDVEIGLGLDLSRRKAFVHPVKKEVELYEDQTQHRYGYYSLWGHQVSGFGVLDNRASILLSW